MDKTITILTIVFQLIMTFITLLVIYMIFALMDYQSGIDGFIGITIIQPIFGAVISILTIFICSIVGLPIRLHKRLNAWWINYFYISLIGIAIGIILIIISSLPYFKDSVTVNLDSRVTMKKIPNIAFLLSGWTLLAFSILHLYPPEILTRKIKSMLQRPKI